MRRSSGPPPRKHDRNELAKLLKKLEGMYEELGDKGARLVKPAQP